MFFCIVNQNIQSKLFVKSRCEVAEIENAQSTLKSLKVPIKVP